MALPKSYLTSVKNLEGILNAMASGQAPAKFTQGFLEGLGFKSNSDRLIIGVLKELGFLTPSGEPTERYFAFLDQTRSGEVLAEALEDAYADLYQLKRRAHELSRNDLKNKIKTISRGQLSDSVLDKTAMTFKALGNLADFDALEKRKAGEITAASEQPPATTDGAGAAPEAEKPPRPRSPGGQRLGGLVYEIRIQLPESRDQAVYDALFRSLREHLVD